MYKYILSNVENINWLAVSSLVLFFMIFVLSSIWILSSRKEYIDHMSNLPLDEE